MGFKYWYESIIFIIVFSVLVLVPCFFTVLFGCKMLNDLGNSPSKAGKIQLAAGWKIAIVIFFTAVGLMAFFNFFN